MNISVRLRKKQTGCTWWEGLGHPGVRRFLGSIDPWPSRTTQLLGNFFSISTNTFLYLVSLQNYKLAIFVIV